MNIFWAAAMTVLSAAGAILLVAAGVGHAVRHREHRAVLRAHGLLPPAFARPATGAELLIGAGTLAVLLAAPANAAPAVVAQAVLYGVFAGYAGVLRVRRPGVPCGCFGTEVVSWAVVARAAVLAAGSAACAALGAAGPLCVAAGAVVAMAVYLLA
ncbi:MauE/DoxX family redox-associated membrane protein [Amycolatopsis solani]|uniref:MauE/DoxX family redox-associated membrane protein n=1 Tax=Amycolatopsis solani TaxID=3028615 RepID=UPI0025AF3066|nr:MauE/DoxX family redox-associated membrane protein [Amycolatopsis sp. MEP2-6]